MLIIVAILKSKVASGFNLENTDDKNINLELFISFIIF